jgi:glyoxylase-like metal-dependent hydrolase (beta-lactamase superfamily II)
VTREEHEFIGGDDTFQWGRLFTGILYEEYRFEDGPYLGFSASRDVYRDGSIVNRSRAGHTPGSLIIFMSLHNGTRYPFVGDLVWKLEGITLREDRLWINRRSDPNAAGTRKNLLRIIALKERLPGLIIVPAHDIRAFAELHACLPKQRTPATIKRQMENAQQLGCVKTNMRLACW